MVVLYSKAYCYHSMISIDLNGLGCFVGKLRVELLRFSKRFGDHL